MEPFEGVVALTLAVVAGEGDGGVTDIVLQRVACGVWRVACGVWSGDNN